MRHEFDKKVRRAAYERSGGICECHRLAAAGVPGFSAEGCGCALGPGNTFYEHIVPDGAGGEPTLENCAAITKTCWRTKTGGFDQPRVAKVKRQKDRRAGIGRAGLKSPPMAGSRRSPWARPMNGNAVRRAPRQ